MGIPSYFSYIIKNHANILNTLHYHKTVATTPFTRLYMDCNSIIYDAFYKLEKSDKYSSMDFLSIESHIISDVILNIKSYIHMINPSTSIFIAFDGVAPFAKMEQQRTRRYKSQFLSSLPFSSKPASGNKVKWNTSSITPGTNFMNMLSLNIAKEFMYKEKEYSVEQIIVSGSTEPGEGEHKMYAHLRDFSTNNDNNAIYGLDSDLIMLSIFHTIYCNNIYIFRESPVFGDVVKNNKKNNFNSNDNTLPLFLNIYKLMKSISIEMNCSTVYDRYRVFDYVFLCFFLGNDFMPHFPSLNIRTHGIQVLLDTYRKVFSKDSNYLLTKNGEHIIWKNVNLFVKELAKNEHTLLLQEYEIRDKWDKRHWSETTTKDKEEIIMNVPVIYRQEEKYICPIEPHWETRYYSTLFDKHNDTTSTVKSRVSDVQTTDFTKSICINYLEGLEWVYTYYTKGCSDWKWKYNYHYPPLLVDLIKYIPHSFNTFIPSNNNRPFSPYAQLCYVLPSAQFVLLPQSIRTHLLQKHPDLSFINMKFQWAYCRYFWEAHNINKPICLKDLEQLELDFSHIVK